MATGKVEDNRTIHRAIRLPGKRVLKDSVDKGERKLATKNGKFQVYQHGGLVTDPNQLEKVAEAGLLDIQQLAEAGVVSGW